MRFLIYLALIPPLFFMYMVYRQDTVEKEPVGLIAKTILFGALSVIPTMILEMLAATILDFLPLPHLLFLLLENFLGVALIEEFCKRRACMMCVWNHPAFNYTFDGIVYGVASAVGFAALENVEYVLGFDGYMGVSGVGIALQRAITAIPAHVIFGIFMGIYLGCAKYAAHHGMVQAQKHYLKLSLLLPMLLHGTYDFMCSLDNLIVSILFYVFIIWVDIHAYRALKRTQAKDTYID